MKLGDWISFNEQHNIFGGDLIVAGIKNNSMNKNDIIFTTVLRTDRAKQLFGSYDLKLFGTDKYPESEFYGIRVLISIPDVVV